MTPTRKEFELFGIIVGDGCISINERYEELAILGDIIEEKEYYESHVIPLFNKTISLPLLNKEIHGKAYSSTGVFGFMVFNSKVAQHFLKFGFKSGPKPDIVLPEIIIKAKPENQKSFLKGLFDTDGSIYFEKNYSMRHSKHTKPKIKLGTSSEKMKNQVKDMCSNLGIRTMDKMPYKGKRDKNTKYELIIYRKSDVTRWIKEIGFSNPKHLTKIEIWRKLGYCPPKTTIAQRKALLVRINAGAGSANPDWLGSQSPVLGFGDITEIWGNVL